jgi:hypothetical protein
MGTMRRPLVVCALLLAACTADKPTPPAADQARPPAPVKPPAPTPAPTPTTPTPPPDPRTDIPTRAQCELYADRVLGMVVEASLPPGASDPDKQAALVRLQPERKNHLAFCLVALETKEVQCVVDAPDYAAMAQCERWRRQVPKALGDHDEVTQADCDRYFIRHRQYMIESGVTPEKVDADREQLVRLCLEKATPSTLACYITARSYEEARRCP